MFGTVMRQSKAHAAARASIASPVWNQCREPDSGARCVAPVHSDRHDSPSKRQNVTTLVSPHSSQVSFSSPSMKRPRLNVGKDAGRRQ